MSEPTPSRFQVWKLATRPHTLTASVVPVIVGYALTLQLVHRNSDLLLHAILPEGAVEHLQTFVINKSNIVKSDFTMINFQHRRIGLIDNLVWLHKYRNTVADIAEVFEEFEKTST